MPPWNKRLGPCAKTQSRTSLHRERQRNRNTCAVLLVLRSHREHGVGGSGILRHALCCQYRLGGASAVRRAARGVRAYDLLRRRSSALPRLSELVLDGVVGGRPLAWTILVGAGLLEIVWAIALKFADGFTRFWPSAIGLAAAVMSFVMLSVALKSLPVGTAYAVWVGIGVFGVAIAGMIALGESVSVLRLTFLALILAGIVGLKMVEA